MRKSRFTEEQMVAIGAPTVAKRHKVSEQTLHLSKKRSGAQQAGRRRRKSTALRGSGGFRGAGRVDPVLDQIPACPRLPCRRAVANIPGDMNGRPERQDERGTRTSRRRQQEDRASDRILALCLAISETLGKSAQTATIQRNIEAANLWAFFQAKTIRMTTLRTAAEEMETMAPAVADEQVRKAAASRIDSWRGTAARYDTEPETQEGRKELMARAQAAEAKRDIAAAAHHHFEVASASFQIAIVLASAVIITGIGLLGAGSIALGVIGIGFTAVGLFAPNAVHLF